MGSSFSILNDTQRDVWIIHGINWEVVTDVLRVISFLLTAGMAVAGARAGEEGALAGGGTSIMAEEGGLV